MFGEWIWSDYTGQGTESVHIPTFITFKSNRTTENVDGYQIVPANWLKRNIPECKASSEARSLSHFKHSLAGNFHKWTLEILSCIFIISASF